MLVNCRSVIVYLAASGPFPTDNNSEAHRSLYVSAKLALFSTHVPFHWPSCPPQESGQIRIINDAVAPLTATGIEGCPEDSDGLCVLLQNFVTAQKTIANTVWD